MKKVMTAQGLDAANLQHIGVNGYYLKLFIGYTGRSILAVPSWDGGVTSSVYCPCPYIVAVFSAPLVTSLKPLHHHVQPAIPPYLPTGK